ncbi:hypothetical protein AN214_01360 [Pseudoalteromonas sp. P1-9]|uniref:hypothetical protein n=1 Tax=Pseudoalteromonas sp. P1-9 TaxID=1710354 RepID=UPI0006D63851|nr:hypothetical protein [Pseudoalteromonas sp. P1-9]KPV96899.1 hypothetical protein AN214_01360 [Pseudoalteromonas sp. P1-9]
MKLIKISPIVALSTLLFGCQSNDFKREGEISTITDAETKLQKTIEDKSCDASYQCRVISYGERACGGPSRFDIYSIKTSKQEDIEFLATEITSFEQAYNQKNEAFSTCEHNPAPQTLCLNKKCEVIKRE